LFVLGFVVWKVCCRSSWVYQKFSFNSIFTWIKNSLSTKSRRSRSKVSNMISDSIDSCWNLKTTHFYIMQKFSQKQSKMRIDFETNRNTCKTTTFNVFRKTDLSNEKNKGKKKIKEFCVKMFLFFSCCVLSFVYSLLITNNPSIAIITHQVGEWKTINI
jgi:hypothetical protein